MSGEEWDEEDFQPAPVVIQTDKWEGEDEDADIKDNWDDENEEEDSEKQPAADGVAGALQVKKKKPLKERLAEKAEQRRKELEERKKQESEGKELTAQEIAAEKLRQQKLQEDADLELAIQAFGATKTDEAKGQIDGMEPATKEDFDKFEELLQQKITKYEKSIFYVPFLESLFRQLAIDLEAEDIKRLGSTLTALCNEKVKQQKSTKGGKKSKQKAAKLILGKETDDAFVEGGYDDYDDFI